MSNRTFKSIFEGKVFYLEEKLYVDSGLLAALESDSVITSRQRAAIEVRHSLLLADC